MRKILFALFPLILMFSSSVRAQDEIRFTNVRVDILPEYDQPSVLYIYRLSLEPDTKLPVQLALKIPATAQINAVAVLDPDKGLLDTQYELVVDGGWAYLNITSTSVNIQLEYYENLPRADQTRSISFEWTESYATDNLVINLLVPRGSQDLIIVPPAIYTGPGEGALSNYQIHTTNLGINQTYIIRMSYKRITDDLEITNLPILPSSMPGLGTPGRVTITGTLPWILGGLGIALVAIGIIGFIVWQREGRESQSQLKPGKKGSAEMIYCRECGKRARPGDNYCRSCGTRLSP